MKPEKIKEELELEFLAAMKSIDKIKALLSQLPENENFDFDCCMSNMIDIKGKLKYFLNKYFDELARNRHRKTIIG